MQKPSNMELNEFGSENLVKFLKEKYPDRIYKDDTAVCWAFAMFETNRYSLTPIRLEFSDMYKLWTNAEFHLGRNVFAAWQQGEYCKRNTANRNDFATKMVADFYVPLTRNLKFKLSSNMNDPRGFSIDSFSDSKRRIYYRINVPIPGW